MTHINDNVITEVSELLISQGFERGIVKSVQSILNHTMLMERQNFLHAKPYERTEQRIDYANGFKDKTLKTRLGEIEVQVPQTRSSNFYPQALEKGIRSERALKLGLAEMYLQGVSTRKVMAITKELCGFEVSSTQVSKLVQELDIELEAWRKRRLGQFKQLILDARYENVRYGGVVQGLAVLWAIGVTEEGVREVLGVSVSLSEAEIHWRVFLKDLVERGLEGLEYIVSDDHEGLAAARKAIFPGVVWQRCQFHLAQNAQNHISKVENKSVVAQEIRDIFNSPTQEMAQMMLNSFVKKYSISEPKLAKWAEENIPEGFLVYQLPPGIRKKFRTSNLIERMNQEIKRRTHIIRVFPNEESCLRLITAILMEIHEDWISGRRYLSKNISTNN